MHHVPHYEDPLKIIIADLKPAAIICFFLVLPFVFLEALSHPINKQNAPGLLVLFGLLWLLSMVFIVILAPVVRAVRAGNSITANPLNLLCRAVFLALIATVWGTILIDQIPCFIGVPNCD